MNAPPLLSMLPLHHPVAIFLIVLVIILLCPLLFRRLKIPMVVGLIVSGIIVGPYGFNILERDASFRIFGDVGILYLMFLAAVEINMFHLKKNLRSGIVFGLLTFLLPMALGVATSRLALGVPWSSAILISTMYAAHTLISYPTVSRFGLQNARPAVIAVSGTIVAVMLALVTLAEVVDTHDGGSFSLAGLLRLVMLMALYAIAVGFSFPAVAKYVFRKVNDSVTQYIFLLALVLLASLIAALIGLEGILGAFYAGLVLNRFVPTRSPLMARIKFVGNAIFIPYFLIGVGMLINVGAIFSGWATAWIALVMTATALVSKWVAAWMSQKLFRLTDVDRRVMFGLTSGKAAATIAATMIGFNYGFIDEGVMNGAILMILACCLVSTVVTERNAIRLRMELTAADLREEGEYMQGAYSRQLVAVANPVTAENIMRMAVMMRHRNNRSRVVALFIRTDDNADTLAMGRNALRAAVAQALAVDLEVADVERYDLNVVNGLISVALENHSSDIIIGMHRRSNIVDTFYGSLIEQLLKASNKMIFMSRCFIPVDTVGRLFVVVPDKAEYETGFKAWVERVGNLASQLACRVVFIATDATFRFISNILADENYAVRLDFMAAESFDDFIIASAQLDPDDLLIVVGARKGSISHSSMLDSIPSYLQKNFSSQNLLVVYPEQFNG